MALVKQGLPTVVAHIITTKPRALTTEEIAANVLRVRPQASDFQDHLYFIHVGLASEQGVVRTNRGWMDEGTFLARTYEFNCTELEKRALGLSIETINYSQSAGISTAVVQRLASVRMKLMNPDKTDFGKRLSFFARRQTTLEQLLDDIRKERVSAQVPIDVRSELNTLRKEVQGKETENQKLREDLQATETELRHVNTAANEGSKHRIALKSEVGELTARVDAIKDELREATTARDDSLSSLSNVESRLQESTLELLGTRTELKERIERIADLERVRPTGLYRSRSDRIVSGLLAGVADHLNFSVPAMRVAFLLVTLLTGGFAGLLVYAIGAWIVPPEPVFVDGGTTTDHV